MMSVSEFAARGRTVHTPKACSATSVKSNSRTSPPSSQGAVRLRCVVSFALSLSSVGSWLIGMYAPSLPYAAPLQCVADSEEQKAEGTRQKADKAKSFRFDCLLLSAFCFLLFSIRTPHSEIRNSLTPDFFS